MSELAEARYRAALERVKATYYWLAEGADEQRHVANLLRADLADVFEEV